MSSILNSLKELFVNKKREEESSKSEDSTASFSEDKIIQPSPKEEINSKTPEAFQEPPARRRVIQAPVIANMADDDGFNNSDEIKIKAEPSQAGDQCKFMVNRVLFNGKSWLFSNFESAAGSPLAESIFSNEFVETVLVHNSTVLITKEGAKGLTDWQELAKKVGQSIRKALDSKDALISAEIVDSIPAENQIRDDIQKIIDTEVNPGVAGHGGHIKLTKVEGNAVTIEMGGGCQGCSAADLTLKQGIHNSFRKAVPFVGAIYDETDHAAGQNPYFS